MNNYYVYVYIDPRNFEEFYYGKGCGSRKDCHLSDQSDTKKANRIKAIKKDGLSPIVRVIAKGLTEQEALLIEKTLLWRLGRWTTNIATGHFSEKFRPIDTFHRQLPGFDFQNGVYYYNVCESIHRNWDDYQEFGFISAGQGTRWRDSILGFNECDIFIAYFKRRGFVGIGRILQKAKMIRNILIQGKPLLELNLKCKRMSDNSNNEQKSEYVCLVKWVKTVPRNEAKWKSGLFTSQHVRSSLDAQPDTIGFIEEQFKVKIKDLIT
ncbi:MAG: hypothetical protein A2Z88_07810 [Omnitrophica WOR_2 bacterium GWA2_47_8]|nr:MAG: hypothetical protein A2Z88_07810 [Omnitrophica WOR_2 bacterium GWA2_47_8]